MSRKRKAPPEGWEQIEGKIEEFSRKMSEAVVNPHEGQRKVQSVWPIFKIVHQRSRYIYNLYSSKIISKELYDYCVSQKYVSAELVAKWKKQGYENLCCLRCIQPKDTNFGTNCICRVPKAKMESNRILECQLCGCKGCSG